jgi:alanine-synthesizing transaminase
MPQRAYAASPRLSEVRYEIRGELAHRARELETRGAEILRLNIGNPGVYGFTVPAHLREAIERNLTRSEAYCVEQGLNDARAAIVAQQKKRGAPNVAVETTFIGNGVSELIDIALRALLAPGDEVLVPSPDYPLWTASTILNGGTAVHYECSAANGFLPDPDALEAQITPRTRALVVINPNNPTGAVYPRALLERLADIATRHKLVLMCDEIYDQVLYDDAEFVPMGRLAPDTLVVTLSGLSKVHRACGYRVGWLSLSGDVKRAAEYVHGLVLLAALRLCSNVTAQWAIVPAPTPSPNSPAPAGACMSRAAPSSRPSSAAVSCRSRSRKARSTPSPASTPRSPARSTTTPGRWTCWRTSRSCWCRDRASTCPTATTSASPCCRRRR